MSIPESALQLRSTVNANGSVTIALVSVPVPVPGPDEVLIRVDATPINPSDMGLLLAGGDFASASRAGSGTDVVTTLTLPPAAVAAQAGRVGESMAVGNEGAGEVVAAGDSELAQSLLGRVVACSGGSMYSQYRLIRANQVLVLPEGTAAVDAASCYVNPLTVLGMTLTMRMENRSAIVHTAAASNLGQMLVKVCKADGIPLVNIVRRPEQVDLLRGIGAEYVVDSSSPTFQADLTDAIEATGATIAFDAISGGDIAGRILLAMETALLRKDGGYNRYGSPVHKQVYIYGTLDRGPTHFEKNFGMAWSIGGWLLTPFLQKAGPQVAREMRERVAREVTTTFASHYTKEIPLEGVLDPANIAVYGRQATGEKFLIRPNA